MNYSRNYRRIALFLILGCFAVFPVYADSTQPGSADDPIVTKSYVDQVIAQKLGGGAANAAPSSTMLTEAKVREIVQSEIVKNAANDGHATGSHDAADTSKSDAAPSSSVSLAMQVVTLAPGQVLYAGSGSEFIVRTGKTIAVSSNEDGIPDVTAGKDIPAGNVIENNHLLIFPKDDGRGIKPDPKGKGDIYVMVRGSYLLSKP